jgi:hypothetical protein
MIRLQYTGKRLFRGDRRMPGVELRSGGLVDVPPDLAERLIATGNFTRPGEGSTTPTEEVSGD